ncbi:MAG: Na+/H+ antiporter NhaC [Calditrichaeota bacterium]|nr:Na+/H+ antiporter NhaC [Calditrichota bacterium]MCB0268203.1 Na+/H+ antiporter NhaC [Calditrichota bacterium]
MSRKLSVVESILPLITMLVLLFAGGYFAEIGTELLVLVMLSAATVASVSAIRVGRNFDDIQQSTGEKLGAVLPMLLILLTIGMLIGTWMISGTIPLMVYYGIQLVSPQYLVLTAFLATAMMSLFTGTSWGSAGTIGVALMSMAAAMGAPLAPTAGAVISGAYFGDKMSPLSDTTNISAIGAGADLYDHVRHMLYTAVPSFIVAVIVYSIFGSYTPAADGALSGTAARLLREIESTFQLSWLVLLPPVIVVIGIIKKYPAVLVMAASCVVAMVLGIALQGFAFGDVLNAAVNGFSSKLLISVGGDPSAISENFGKLLNRGGLFSMVNNLLLIIAAFLLAGAMDVSGALDKIIHSLLSYAKSTFGLIAATMASGGVMIAITSHGGVTALIVGGLFQKAYAERGFAPENLSRSLEDSVTITEPLMPWTVSAIFMAGTVGVPTLEYLPWATFCYTGTLFSLLLAAGYDFTKFGLKMQLQPASTL